MSFSDNSLNWGIFIFIILVSICACGFNIFTITIIFISKKLRRSSNYAIASFMFAAAIQAVFAIPVYIYKRLEEHPNHRPLVLICDVYRFSYFFCGHMMKVSLIIISYDRLIAIKFPYKHGKLITKRNMRAVLIISWLSVVAIDLLPFLPLQKGDQSDGCSYRPFEEWSICVIVVFNMVPFVILLVNYSILWKVAAKMKYSDVRQQESLSMNDMSKSERRQIDVLSSERTSFVNSKVREKKSSNQKKRRRKLRFALEMKATKTSLMLLLLYLICWGPLGIFYMIDNLCRKCLTSNKDLNLKMARLLVKILSFLASPIAPLVYCWRTKTFRNETRNIICKKRTARERKL